MTEPVFEVLKLRDWVLVRVEGELDMATAPLMRSHLLKVTDKKPVGLLLDLNAVTFVDSTGLGVLVGVAKRMRQAESEFKIVCTQSHLLELFELTQLDEVFAISPTYESALGDVGIDAETVAKLDEDSQATT